MLASWLASENHEVLLRAVLRAAQLRRGSGWMLSFDGIHPMPADTVLQDGAHITLVGPHVTVHVQGLSSLALLHLSLEAACAKAVPVWLEALAAAMQLSWQELAALDLAGGEAEAYASATACLTTALAGFPSLEQTAMHLLSQVRHRVAMEPPACVRCSLARNAATQDVVDHVCATLHSDQAANAARGLCVLGSDGTVLPSLHGLGSSNNAVLAVHLPLALPLPLRVLASSPFSQIHHALPAERVFRTSFGKTHPTDPPHYGMALASGPNGEVVVSATDGAAAALGVPIGSRVRRVDDAFVDMLPREAVEQLINSKGI